MAWELEGLIARLLMLISCAGEHGKLMDALAQIRVKATQAEGCNLCVGYSPCLKKKHRLL